jgi:predicted regulator of amino acid metabolism with ACT domain
MLYWWYLTNAEVPLMKFELQADDKAVLEKLVKSGMTPVIISQRAQILLKKAENKSSTKVAEELNVNRHTVELWCQKYRNRTPEQTIMYSALLKAVAGKKKSPEKRKHGSSV